jgi:hypothetical protein
MVRQSGNIPIIVSFYTDDEIYLPAAERLRISLEKFNLTYEIVCCPKKGNWNANCLYKTEFIHTMLQHYYPLELIWMDADSEVLKYPELLGRIESDIAAVINKQGVFASLIYFRNNYEVKKLIEAWIQANKNNPNEFTGDQINLERVLKDPEYKDTVTFQELPWEYSYIPDVMGGIDDPVIIQHQASRQGRNLYP